MQQDLLIERIKGLPPDKIAEVTDFVDFLWYRIAKTKETTQEADIASELKSIAESMKANTFTGDPPHFTREDLHERR